MTDTTKTTDSAKTSEKVAARARRIWVVTDRVVETDDAIYFVWFTSYREVLEYIEDADVNEFWVEKMWTTNLLDYIEELEDRDEDDIIDEAEMAWTEQLEVA